MPCKSQRSSDIPELVPAIAAFKNLTKLTIEYCPNLTDICVVQGITLNTRLKEVTIVSGLQNNGRITEVSVNALQISVLNLGRLTWKSLY